MNTVPIIKQKTKPFQIRWHEPLGKEGAPYAYRWVFIFFGYSIRVHHWLCSDALTESGEKHFHNHPWWFITIILKGGYIDCIKPPIFYKNENVGVTKEKLKQFDIRKRGAEHMHYVIPNKGGCWSLLLTGKPINTKWGFWVENRILRPIKYFRRFGSNAPCYDNKRVNSSVGQSRGF